MISFINQNVLVQRRYILEKRITIKDIAQLAGVSIGSVHCALNDKPGVSETTRKKIIRVANEHGYKPNVIAASLKRKPLKIAAAIPALTGENKFYYNAIWEGVSDCINTLGDYNIELISAPYYDSQQNSQIMEMQNLMERNDINGLISVGYTPTKGLISLQQAKDKHVPIVLVGNDVPDSERLCCVLPNYLMVGRTMAELMIHQLPKDSPILICAGFVQIPSNYLIVEGFQSYMKDHGFTNPVHIVHSSMEGEEANMRARKVLNDIPIKGCIAVTSRTSAMLAKALVELKPGKDYFCIGMDLFQENIQALREGVFNNLIHNNPYKSAYMATKILVEYLLKESRPIMDTLYVGSEVVFQSNLPMYENGYYRLLM